MSKNKINGVLLLNKEYNISSNQALMAVKKILQPLKLGHAGTLDPMATGLLPICLGEATKFISYILESDKEYIATIKLGITTDTYDLEGKILSAKTVNISQTIVENALASFVGKITQIPPIYSALKYNGRPLYEYARAGIAIQPNPRVVTIKQIKLINYNQYDQFQIEIKCTKGTYIRSLAYDIGMKIGCGATLYGLIRTKSSNFTLAQACTLAELKLNNHQLLNINSLTSHLDCLTISSPNLALENGNSFLFKTGGLKDGDYQIYYQEKFFGVASLNQGVLSPKRLINYNNIQ